VCEAASGAGRPPGRASHHRRETPTRTPRVHVTPASARTPALGQGRRLRASRRRRQPSVGPRRRPSQGARRPAARSV